MKDDVGARVPWRDWYHDLFAYLEASGLSAWRRQLDDQLRHRFEIAPHGDLPRWLGALAALPSFEAVNAHLDRDRVEFSLDSSLPSVSQRHQLEEALRALMPWRKGPFDFFGVTIDTEWRSDWKWQRVAPHLDDLSGRTILDVGCGSGYHCWRMAGAGARRVLGIDPGLLFLCQFMAAKRYAGKRPVDLLPLRMEDLPANLAHFDTVFSMGVLYHRRSPLDHLAELFACLRPGGQAVLETLVVEGPAGYSLMPRDRYAMMRNVWFIPSVATLEHWMARMGFEAISTVDVSPTTTEEQRRTDWMRFQSLADFLDPNDASRTIEGYPAPLRATVVARRPR